MPRITHQVRDKAIEILKNQPSGIRYSELVASLKNHFPQTPINTIHGATWDLHTTHPSQVYKPERGLFKHINFKGQAAIENPTPTRAAREINEEDFYESFAEYLTNDLEECTKAIKLGGNKFRDKWGTPDVIGIKKPMPSDIIKSQIEVISSEIKIDTNGLITAFGQACAYRIFSDKVYMVIPKDSSEEDKSRIESLCLIFGIGLIFFDSSNPENPQFGIRVRPLKHEPDMFYVNKYIKMIENELFS